MTRLNFWRIGLHIGFGLLLLTACSTKTIRPDQDVALKPGEGIAAIVFDTLDQLTAVTIKSPDNGRDIEISLVEKGVHMYVYAVPAGSYCLVKFNTNFYTLTQDDPTHGVCFYVVSGKVAYSGNLSPRAYGHSLRTDQNYDWPAFEKMFREQYPRLAQYPVVTP